ncbi:MAG: DNA polymerase III subunit gamma/tau [Rhodothalassiaceae bacterium]
MSDTAYRVLARKYRPQTFAELIGQEAMVRTLANAFRTGRLAQGFMLTGVRGVGKTTTARIIAKGLNCLTAEGPTTEPCGRCDNCLGIAESRHFDVLEMDAASHTGVEDIRDIIDGVRYAPQAARFKVYIIDEVHMLSKNAFNALLKTLEEPPPHVKFLFATTEIRKVPVTILSRCQRFDLKRVDGAVLVAHLQSVLAQEGLTAEEEALTLIARAAEGSVRDSLSLLDQAIAHGGETIETGAVRTMLGLADRSRVLDLVRAVFAGDTPAALALLDEQYQAGADPAVVMNDLLESVHWLTRLKVAPDAGADLLISQAERAQGADMAKDLAMAQLTRAWQMLLKGLGEVREAPQPMQAAEMVLIRLCFAADLPSPAEAVRQLQSDRGAPAVDATGPASAAPAAPAGPVASAAPAQMSAPARPATAQVVALKQLETPPAAAAPPNFQALVQLFEDRRESLLAFLLKDQAVCGHYSPGRLLLGFVKAPPRDTFSRIKACLEHWTGRDWHVALSPEVQGRTLAEQQQAEHSKAKADAAAHPVVKRILEAFPRADLQLRPVDTAASGALMDEPAPAPPDEDDAP